MTATRVHLSPEFAGAKFRPVTWHALTDDGANLVGYGVEVKGPKDRRYKVATVKGDSVPFTNKKDVAAWCKAANELAHKMRGSA
jgi:hypothetical protein